MQSSPPPAGPDNVSPEIAKLIEQEKQLARDYSASLESKAEAPATPSLREQVEKLREELSGDAELVRQALADMNALNLQEHRQALDARIEYARQISERDKFHEESLKEYGLQTLKWVFLLNAGAIGLLLTFIGTRNSRSDIKLEAQFPLIVALWPFALGCILIAIAGFAAYVNFSAASGRLPSVEAMFNFFDTRRQVLKWPSPKAMKAGESEETFYRRIHRWIDASRNVAIVCAGSSMLLFIYGVWRAIRASTGG